MAKYSDEYKANAVAQLVSAGYPDDSYALKRVADTLECSARTLKRWFEKDTGAPPDKVVHDKKRDMIEALQDLMWKLYARASDWQNLAELDSKQAITAMAIVIDKMRLLQGLPTQIISIMPDFVQACEAIDENPEDVMRRMVDRMRHVEQTKKASLN